MSTTNTPDVQSVYDLSDYYDVESLGGGQYRVTNKEDEYDSSVVDLDGYDIMPDEVYELLEAADIVSEEAWSPSEAWRVVGYDDLPWCAAIVEAANHSGVTIADAEELIAEAQEV